MAKRAVGSNARRTTQRRDSAHVLAQYRPLNWHVQRQKTTDERRAVGGWAWQSRTRLPSPAWRDSTTSAVPRSGGCLPSRVIVTPGSDDGATRTAQIMRSVARAGPPSPVETTA